MSRWRGSKHRYRSRRQKMAMVVNKIRLTGADQLDPFYARILAGYDRRRQKEAAKRNPAHYTRATAEPHTWKLADQTKRIDARNAKRAKAAKRRRK